MRIASNLGRVAAVAFAAGFCMWAQAPTGTILGTVKDASGAVVPSANLTITNKDTGASRTINPNSEGLYSAPALLSGLYEVRAELRGFRTVVRDATVEAGTNTTVDILMSVGEEKEIVTVEAATAQINYESQAVSGVVERQTIQELPLNGRSFMQLSQLEPGVTVTPASTSQQNAVFSVSIMGGSTGRTLMTIDGAEINDDQQGGTGMNFSQEVVQEFQLSSVNYDLSTGIGGVGAVNVVTRSGTADFHGSAYFFYRDHNMAAYPALKRSALNPNPFFARKNPGVWVGGPVIKDKLFFFTNYEYMNQSQAVTFAPDIVSATALTSIVSSPFTQTLATARLDYRFSSRNNIFVRYSHDNNQSYGPPSATSFQQQSNWVTNTNWADQAIIGLTTIISSTLVNDARFGFYDWHNQALQSTLAQCSPPACVGGGLPEITPVQGSSNVQFGGFENDPNTRLFRRYEAIDTLSWQKGTHRMKFGVDYVTTMIDDALWGFCLPMCLGAYSPETARAGVSAAALPLLGLPSQIATTQDVLNLPVYNNVPGIYGGVGIGDYQTPGPYNYSQFNHNNRPRVYATDTWKVSPRLTVNYGLGWEADLGLFNSSINKPAYLLPIFGTTSPTKPNLRDFSPSAGFAWSLDKSGKTVIRGGGGIYWDSINLYYHWRDEASIGPVGDMRNILPANAFTNTLPGILNFNGNSSGTPLPIGAPIPLQSLTNMTVGQFIQIVNAQLPGLASKLGATAVPTSGAFATSGIDVFKTGTELDLPSFPQPRSYQLSIGVQRDLGHDMVVTADYARRVTVNQTMPAEVDFNHFNEFVNGVKTPVIPLCTASQLFVPGQECSNGPITVWDPYNRAVYNGLLVKLNKRLSHRYQFVASYAYQSNDTIAGLVNYNNLFQGYGDVLPRQNLNIAGIVRLPWDFQLSVNASFISRSPVTPVVPNVDLSGTGAAASGPLPGIAYNCINDGCGKTQLAAAVTSFNSTYAGGRAPNGALIPQLILPPAYQLGDPTFSQDFRLSKVFRYKERYSLSVFAEMFNAFNIANLSGYSFNLNTVAANPANQTFTFGQPTARAVQTFGSGGPRALQVGARIQF